MEQSLVSFLAQYRWLLDSYVIEFFTEDHWTKLPHSWREPLSEASLKEVAQLLLNDGMPFYRKRVYPLSLLAFSATTHSLSVSRKFDEGDMTVTNRKAVALIPSLNHLFRRHVKPKKQHEIKLLGEVIFEMSCRTKCKNIIDVGSGQGHLARYLAFNYGLNVTAIEAVGCHLAAATKFDSEVEKNIAKKKHHLSSSSPVQEQDAGSVRHIETLISPEMSMSDLLLNMGLETELSSSECSHSMLLWQQDQEVCSTFHSKNGNDSAERSRQHFVLVGLHTCGDLASTMFRLFNCSEQIVGLVSVGCCYMKLTCSEELQKSPDEVTLTEHAHHPTDKQRSENTCIRIDSKDDGLQLNESSASAALPQKAPLFFSGYPMSALVRSLPGHTLSYEAREVACHSIEVYLERCLGGEDLNHLKIHCHRAAVETILRKNGMRKAQVRISKRISKLPFVEYAQMLIRSVNLPLLTSEDLQKLCLLVDTQWENVAKFFMLRLALAPCVESLVLLDRMQFLREQGHCNVQLLPVFDPKLSPRNLVVLAT